MKNIKKALVSIGLIAVVLCMCSFEFYPTRNKNTGNINLCEYKLNGHYYVVASTWSFKGGVGIIHSPNCKCGKK